MWRPWSDSSSDDSNNSNTNIEEQLNVPDSENYVYSTQETGTQNINIEPDSSIIIPETSSDAASTSNCNTNQYLQYINILEEQNVQAGTYIFLLLKKFLLKIYNIIWLIILETIPVSS